jgi:hypothetical protein
MQIPGFIQQIPNPFQMIWGPITYMAQTPINAITGIWTTSRDYCSQTNFWQQQGKPLYERNIQPLTKFDFMLLSGSVMLSSAGTIYALSKCGVAALPLTIGFAALSVLGACGYSRYCLRNHFKEIAWGHVDNIRRAANKTTNTNQNLGTIADYRKHLEKPEFDDLNDDKKQLDEEIRKFRSVALAPYYEDKLQILTGHLKVLKDLVQANVQDKALVEALEAEVNKVKKPEQNLEKLETQKQALRQLKTPTAHFHFNEVSKQINDLIKVAQSPDFDDAKNAFMQYLTGLMGRLAHHKKIEALSPLDPLDADTATDAKDPAEDEDKNPPGLDLNKVLLKEDKKDDEKVVENEKVVEIEEIDPIAVEIEEGK